MCEKVMLTV